MRAPNQHKGHQGHRGQTGVSVPVGNGSSRRHEDDAKGTKEPDFVISRCSGSQVYEMGCSHEPAREATCHCFIAGSQCSSALALTNRHMSNHVVV